MENDVGEYYLYVEETPGDVGQFVREFTNQEFLRQFAKGRTQENPACKGRGYRMKPKDTPVEIML